MRAARNDLHAACVCGTRGGPGRVRCDRMHLLKEENRARQASSRAEYAGSRRQNPGRGRRPVPRAKEL